MKRTDSCLLILLLTIGSIYLAEAELYPVNSLTSQVGQGKTPTKLSALISKFEIIIGANDSIVIKLEPAVQGAAVNLMITTPNGDTRNIPITMGSEGKYIYAFTPDAGGLWRYQASWEGDANHSGSISDRLGFVVTLHENIHTHIIVTVIDKQGIYISGAAVTSTAQPEGQAKLSGVTDNLGSVHFYDVKPGVYSFSISKGELNTTLDSLKVKEGSQSNSYVPLFKTESSSGSTRVPGYPEVSIIMGVLIVIMARRARDPCMPCGRARTRITFRGRGFKAGS